MIEGIESRLLIVLSAVLCLAALIYCTLPQRCNIM